MADTEGWHGLGHSSFLWLGTVVEDAGDAPYVVPKFLLNPRSSWTGNHWTEIQPAMGPDGKTMFFNSDRLCRTGHPRVFAARGVTVA